MSTSMYIEFIRFLLHVELGQGQIDIMYLKHCLCQIDTACIKLHLGCSFLALDFLHIRFGTSMPFQEGCVHSIKASEDRYSS